jgi:hypothetical protein
MTAGQEVRMGKALHLAGMIAALLLVAAPAYAVGQSIGDTGKPAPKAPRWDSHVKKAPRTHGLPTEDWSETRERCKRNHETACVRHLKPVEAEPLRDDLRAVAH